VFILRARIHDGQEINKNILPQVPPTREEDDSGGTNKMNVASKWYKEITTGETPEAKYLYLECEFKIYKVRIVDTFPLDAMRQEEPAKKK
jgi:hypothetical protein